MRAALGVPALAVALAACGGGAPTPADDGPPIGTDETAGGEATIPEAVEGSVELSLRRADGTFLEVGELRGHVVVLFVLATFDGPSQMSIRPLTQLVETDPDVRVVGVAAQQGARLLVDAYEAALTPPFPITYDPIDSITDGTSALGPLEAIPTLVVLDARGVEVGRHVGYCDEACLAELIAAAR